MKLKLAFAKPLAYVRNEGLRTANFSRPFKALYQFGLGNCTMVGPVGLEPTTKGFTVTRRFRWEWTISSPLARCLGCGTL